MNKTTQTSSHSFRMYVIRLVVRSFAFAGAIYFFVVSPEQLSPGNLFLVNLTFPFHYIDLIFVLLVFDMATKLFPKTRIAIGSRKQFARYHLPNGVLAELLAKVQAARGIKESAETAFSGGREIIGEAARAVASDAQEVADNVRASLIANQKWLEDLIDSHTKSRRDKNAKESAPQKSISSIIASASKTLLAIRAKIRWDRTREIVPVVVLWVTLNAAILFALLYFGWLSQETCVLWAMFYFVFDMICVVAWCPIQTLLMRNRCCTTCTIFNWDAGMTATPLLFAPSIFSFILIALAAIVLVKWEVSFARHPERFSADTNDALTCKNCEDKLCRIRKPILDDIDFPEFEQDSALSSLDENSQDAIQLGQSDDNSNDYDKHDKKGTVK